jgi:oxygen-dependent protoporphyrinogen oxidase
LRGVLAQKRASRGNGKTPRASAAPSMFMTLRGGLQQMTDALVARLDRHSLLANRRVVAVTRDGGTYEIAQSDGTHLRADEIVFASPAHVTADLVEPFAPALAEALRAIRYVSTATVSLGFKREEMAHPLDGFGFVVPRSEKRKIIACSWSSTKFNDRAPAGYALMRVFIGGAQAEHLAEEDDCTLTEIAREELRAMMGIAATPALTKVYRWHKANPQFEVGHQTRIAEIDRLAQEAGVRLAGAAYHGVGIPDCIESGARVTDEILGRKANDG